MVFVVNEWRGQSPRFGAGATHLQRNVAKVASHWRPCADLTVPVIEPQTFRTVSVCLTTKLIARYQNATLFIITKYT